MTLNLDKTGWKRVAFGDVVRNVNHTVKDPAAAGLDRVIAMEHLEPGELKITRWGDIADGTTFTRRVTPGQTLFGKRRAYQRKAAYAEFDAICSGDILTFEADPAHLLAEFLPFIVQSDGFYDHALGTSAGSLSPRTNWRDLSNYEFDLPPLDEQKRIVDLMWALERHRNAMTTQAIALEKAMSDYCRITYATARREAPCHVSIQEVAELRMGRQKSPKYQTGQHSTLYLRVANVGNLALRLDDLEEMDFNESDLAKYELRPGDLVLTEGDIVSALNVGRAAIFPGLESAVCFQNTLIRARPANGVPSEYLLTLFEGMRLAGVFASAASTTTVTHLGLGRLAALKVPDVPQRRQQEIAAGLARLLHTRRVVAGEIEMFGDLRSSLLADIFGGAA